jgi:subtilisin-like proprotein convertase family protein
MHTDHPFPRFSGAAAVVALLTLASCGREGYQPPAPTPCDGITCSGHGSCADLAGAAYCVCDEGYYSEGLTCLEYVVQNPCEGVTCSGYGICAVRNGAAMCVCAQGYHTPPDNRANCVADTHPCDGEDGSPCDDTEFCTVDDVCMQGICRGQPNECSDGNPCTVDICNELEDRCVGTAAPDQTPCDDGHFCTLGELCLSGECTQGYERNCEDGNPCTQDRCDAAQDTCVNEPIGEGDPCDDGAFCSEGETCQGGVCGFGGPRDCRDENACTLDFCDETSDTCVHDGEPLNGLVCDDGLYCTVEDACQDGACAGLTPRACADTNTCTMDTCDEVGDACVHDASASDGVPCNDGAFCTIDDRCSSGACQGGSPRDCDDGNLCTLDMCDEVLDSCVGNGQASDGAPCDDGLYCNMGEVCTSGFCSGGTPRTCNDGLACTADACDEAGDACVNDTGAADGRACNDDRFCTQGETCLGGACQGGAPNPCNDGNPCTADSCDVPSDQCVNDVAGASGLPCDDNAYCTVGEACSGGSCVGGNPRDCADVNPCTADSCNEVSDQCTHAAVPEGTACNDQQFCTLGEACAAGACVGGGARGCSDGNPCTADSCDEPSDSCLHDAAASNGLACDDGAYCVVGESCQGGACGGGGPRDCADANPCTADVCNEAQDRCDHDGPAMNGASCSSGNYCVINESCANGACAGGAVRACDDLNPCTANNCNEALNTCQNPPLGNGTPCEDGQFCTSGDTCQGGACQSGASDPCLADPCSSFCNEATNSCGGCAPAGTYCQGAAQAATCDGACNLTQLVICPYGCNAARNECNECEPSMVECRGDAELLCNADHTCGPNGLLLSTTCCTTNQCTCDAAECLEDFCATAADLSAGGSLSGTTCTQSDHIPGDCNPGGAACRAPAQGGGPEALFRLELDDGLSTSRFYNLSLSTAGSALDTFLRLSTVCGNENLQMPYAGVCHTPTPGVSPLTACTSGAGPDSALLCGLPEGEYYGAVDSAAGTCNTFTLNATVTPVSLETPAQAGNVSRGGVFTGSTCGMVDNGSFPDTTNWSGTACGNCVSAGGGTVACPDCGLGAAADCTISSTDDKCAYSGTGSPDAVFYLALPVDAGVDISTEGSDFDTVIYVMQTGAAGPNPPGLNRVCSDDCKVHDGYSHIQTSLPAGLYYLYMDGAGGACGNYVLRVQVSPAATCGNLSCEEPYETCTNCPADCDCPHCGDGVIQDWEGEACDDGDLQGGDCCSAICSLESGCVCYSEPSICGVPTPRNYSHTCSCTIPDSGNTPPGTARTDTISVPVACSPAALSVDLDISHTYPADLIVTLTSPLGTTVTLKNRSGTGSGIVGTFETSLSVDGPGSLSSFLGQNAQGTWTLTAQDWARADTGTLNTWGLHLQCL